MSSMVLLDVARSAAAPTAGFLGLLMAASATHKALHWRHASGVAGRFVGLPPALAPAALTLALLGECAAAALLLLPLPGLRQAGAELTAAILALYLLLILRAVLQGRRGLDCGCSFGSGTPRLGYFQVARNVSLLMLSVGVALSVRSAPPLLEIASLLPAAALLTLYAALDQVMALGPLRTGVTS